MDYHDIDMKGPFIGQRTLNLPTWTANDEGREIYDITNHKKYYGGSSGWVDYIDGKVLVSSADSVRKYLEDKIIAGNDIEINTLVNDVNNSRKLSINFDYTPPSNNYIVCYNSNDQIDDPESGGYVWTDLTFTDISKSNGLSLTNSRYVDLAANIKYNISYNVMTEKQANTPYFFIRFHVISGDTTWDLDNISDTRQELYLCNYFNLTYSGIIVPSSTTRIGLQAYVQKYDRPNSVYDAGKITYASISIWT